MQHGKNLLECLIQPLQASSVTSSHAASITASSVICVCRLRSYTFHQQAEKTSSIELRNGDYGSRNPVSILWLLANICLILLEWWKLTLSHMTTYLNFEFSGALFSSGNRHADRLDFHKDSVVSSNGSLCTAYIHNGSLYVMYSIICYDKWPLSVED